MQFLEEGGDIFDVMDGHGGDDTVVLPLKRVLHEVCFDVVCFTEKFGFLFMKHLQHGGGVVERGDFSHLLCQKETEQTGTGAEIQQVHFFVQRDLSDDGFGDRSGVLDTSGVHVPRLRFMGKKVFFHERTVSQRMATSMS